MHLNFHFTAAQTLWTITFAAQLVLLIVLLGRDRIKRFPWFTLSIVLMAIRLLASRLLFGRMPTVALSAIFIAMAAVAAIVGFLVVVEMARRAFAPVRRGTWLTYALLVLVVGGGILAAWGPWPAWKTLAVDSLMGLLRAVQLAAQRIDMLVDLLTVELGLLVVLLGRAYRRGLAHPHPARGYRTGYRLLGPAVRGRLLAADCPHRRAPLAGRVRAHPGPARQALQRQRRGLYRRADLVDRLSLDG